MDEIKNSKTIIYAVLFIFLILGYLLFQVLNNKVFNAEVKELNYFYQIENEESIDDLLNNNQKIILKNNIQKYLEQLEYEDKEINNIQIKIPKKENKKVFTCYVLLDDNWQSLYKIKYNIPKEKCQFTWNGDINNQDYKPSKNAKCYLYVVDREQYKEKKLNDDIEKTVPDENVDPEDDYSE